MSRVCFRVFAFLSGCFHAEGMEDVDKALGQRIKRLRDQRRWTQEQLADLLHVTTKTIGNWEHGRHNPRNSLAALEAVFKVPLDDDDAQEGPDPVETAIWASRLTVDRGHVVLGVYRRELRLQDEEVERGRSA